MTDSVQAYERQMRPEACAKNSSRFFPDIPTDVVELQNSENSVTCLGCL